MGEDEGECMNALSPDPDFERIVSFVVSDSLPESAVERTEEEMWGREDRLEC